MFYPYKNNYKFSDKYQVLLSPCIHRMTVWYCNNFVRYKLSFVHLIYFLTIHMFFYPLKMGGETCRAFCFFKKGFTDLINWLWRRLYVILFLLYRWVGSVLWNTKKQFEYILNFLTVNFGAVYHQPPNQCADSTQRRAGRNPAGRQSP